MAVDFTKYDDQSLEELRVSVLKEQERRARKSEMPEQIENLSREALEFGLSEAEIREAFTNGLMETDQTTE